MTDVSLTTFVDFVSKAGTPKLTVVSQCKHQPAYQPAIDFYKPLRDAIVDLHRKQQSISVLNSPLQGLNDKKKLTAYPPIVAAYRKWLGRKTITWFRPPSGTWSHSGLQVNINPELGLTIGGVPYLIKLYFKKPPLSKNRTDIVTHLLHLTCSGQAPAGCIMAVLDLRASKLISATSPIPGLTVQLEGEAAYWMTVWPQV